MMALSQPPNLTGYSTLWKIRKTRIHGVIVKHAKCVLGVDILPKEVEVLNQRGYNMVCANVETMELKDTFELVIAGDLIEHLSNPGLFMDRVVEHLEKGGQFLITTPNPVTFIRFAQMLLTGRLGVNPEHTGWFTPEVINELARRSHLRIVEIAYVDDTYQYFNTRSKLWWPLLAINYLVCRIRPQASETLCFVLQQATPID